MLTLLKRTRPNEVMPTTNRAEAIYFQVDDGPLRPIAELTDAMVANSGVVANIPTDVLPEPLPMPTLNEGGQDEQPGPDDPLPLPKMNFDTTKTQKTARNSGDGLPSPLPLPTMK
jgi:hypothetical protein